MPIEPRVRPEPANANVVRPRGRQAEAAVNDGRVLDAAREVFATAGWDAPVSLVAQRAGVGMGTLYRRYGSKQDLLQHLCLLSLQQLTQHAESALSDSTPDPWMRFETFVHRCVLNRVGAFGRIAGRLPASNAMSRAAEQAHLDVQRLISASQQMGVLRQDVTAVDVHELLELFSQRESTGPRPTGSDAGRDGGTHLDDRLLAILLSGMRAEAAVAALPPAMSWDEYRSRWETRTIPG